MQFTRLQRREGRERVNEPTKAESRARETVTHIQICVYNYIHVGYVCTQYQSKILTISSRLVQGSVLAILVTGRNVCRTQCIVTEGKVL